MSEPLLTVLMPVYNAESHVHEAVKSVLNQSFSDFKLLVVNDGSTDKSVEIIEASNDSRIEFLHLPQNGGLVNALNTGLDNIDSKYIARTDADDVCLPDRLTKQIAFMESHPTVGALGTGFDSLHPNGEIKTGTRFSGDHNMIRFKHMYQIHIIHGTAMLRNSVIKVHNLRFDPKFKHAEDYDFFDRLGDVSEISNLAESHYLIRQHDGRVSSQFSETQWNNSGIVKQRVLSNMGVQTTEHELNLLMWMMYQNYEWYTDDYTNELIELVDKVLDANLRSKYLPADFFRKQLTHHVLHLLIYQAGKGKNVRALIRKSKYFRFADNPRLMLSALVKSIVPS